MSTFRTTQMIVRVIYATAPTIRVTTVAAEVIRSSAAVGHAPQVKKPAVMIIGT